MKWPTVPIGELVTIRGGGTPQRNNEAFFQGDIPWVTPKDMKRWEIGDAQIKITREAIEQSAANEIPRDTVLLVVRSGVLKHTAPVATNRRIITINQDMKSLQCNDRLAPEYLARFLKSVEPTILTWVRATTADNYSIDKVRELPIPLPSLDEQRRIAAILDQADDLRRKRREASEKLECLERAIFVHLTTSTGSEYNKPLEDIIRVRSGEFLPQQNQVSTGQYAVFGGNGINGFHDQCNVEPSTIVIGRVGVYCGVIHMTKQKAWVTDNALIVDIKEPNVAPIFLAAAMKHANLNQYAGRSAQPLISGGRVYPVRVPIPPLAVQRAFAARVAEIDKLKALHGAHLANLDALFASLQHRAFRGEL